MNNIPKKLRSELSQDPWMDRCIIDRYKKYIINMASESDLYCNGKIEWHHVWMYGGKQIQEIFAIVPICRRHHKMEETIRFFIEWVSLMRITKEDIDKYYKKAPGWLFMKKMRCDIFGNQLDEKLKPKFKYHIAGCEIKIDKSEKLKYG